MRKWRITMSFKKIILFSFLLIALYLQYGRAPIINQSITSKDGSGYETRLTITANKLLIVNQKQLSQRLALRIRQNEFPNMQLPTDTLQHLNKITVIVYVNRLAYILDLPAFEFTLNN